MVGVSACSECFSASSSQSVNLMGFRGVQKVVDFLENRLQKPCNPKGKIKKLDLWLIYQF